MGFTTSSIPQTHWSTPGFRRSGADKSQHLNQWRIVGVVCLHRQTDRAMALFEHSRQLNPHIPGHHYYAPFMVHAYRAEHDQALSYAKQIRMPSFFIDPVARAAALGHLGHKDEAGAALAELLEIVPDFKESGRESLQRLFRYKQPVEIVVEGLRKAGMEL